MIEVITADRIEFCVDCGKEHGFDCPLYAPRGRCICKEQGGCSPFDEVICHLSWCPHSYVYIEAMIEFEKASWWKKLFMYKPWNHPNGY